jgi:hypothetical protein
MRQCEMDPSLVSEHAGYVHKQLQLTACKCVGQCAKVLAVWVWTGDNIWWDLVCMASNVKCTRGLVLMV